MPFLFEDFELDEELFELRRGGERVALRPQALDVLLLLAKNAHRVVTKADILAAVWPGARVSETALPQAILAVRRALGDDDEDPRFVQTVRSRGYRFVAEVTRSASPPALAGRGEGPALVTSLPFVGRDALLSAARSALARAASGAGGALLVAGGVGAGKTRALLEIAALARAPETRAATLSGRCYEDEGVPELWPWTQVMRALGGAMSSPASPGGPGFGAFDAVTGALVAASRVEPVVVLLDDVHLADAGTLLLLKLVARAFASERALVVASYLGAALADNAVLARAIGALAREDPSRCVALEPLDRDAVAVLGRAALGEELAPATVTRLEAKTGGCPLFLTQLLHAMRSDARFSSFAEGSTSALLSTDTMREAVGLHLRDLPGACSTTLSAAAVLGRTFAVPPLAKMVGAPPEGVVAALDAALGARIVARLSDATFTFVHELVRDVLYKKLTIAERVTLHRAAASALAEVGDVAGARAQEERTRALVG